jgi:hypothetical protein
MRNPCLPFEIGRRNRVHSSSVPNYHLR